METQEKRYVLTVSKNGKSLSWGLLLTERERRLINLVFKQLARFDYLTSFKIKEGISYDNGCNAEESC